MYIRVLGETVEVSSAEGETVALQPLTAAALGLLIVVGGQRGISRQLLRDMLWGRDDPTDRTSSLAAIMSKLRKLLGRERIVYAPDRYTFAAGQGDYVDLTVLRLLAARAGQLRTVDPEAAAGLCKHVLDRWTYSPLATVPCDSVAMGYLEALTTERQAIVESMLENLLESGRHRDVVALTPVLIARDPLNEYLRSLRMIALARSGQKALALREYERAEAAVMSGMGVKPGLALQDTRSKIEADDPELEWRGTTTSPNGADDSVLGSDRACSIARMANYALGGKNNFSVDRIAVETMLAAAPGLRKLPREVNDFHRRAMEFAHESGSSQFIEVDVPIAVGKSSDQLVESEPMVDRSLHDSVEHAVKLYLATHPISTNGTPPAHTSDRRRWTSAAAGPYPPTGRGRPR